MAWKVRKSTKEIQTQWDNEFWLLTFRHKAFIILLNFTYHYKGSDEEEYIGFRKPREKMAGVNLREEGMEVASELRS